MGIIQDLISAPQREVSGSTATSRFRYQQNWALASLIACHRSGEDYSFAFEFHEDVLKLNSSRNPSTVVFYQVKTKGEGVWSLKSITSRGKDNDLSEDSFLDKLYANRESFRGMNAQFIFVSNCYYRFLNTIGKISAEALGVKDKNTVRVALEEKFPDFKENDLKSLLFEVSGLTLDNHENTVVGQIVGLFKAELGEASVSHALVWHRHILYEIRLKNDHLATDVKTEQDFIDKKCITRDMVLKTFEEIKLITRIRPGWATMKSLLIHAGAGLREIAPIEQEWERFAIQKLDYNDSQLQSVTDEIRKCCSEIETQDEMDLFKVLEAVYALFNKKSGRIAVEYSEGFIKAAILWVLYENSKQL